MNAPIYYSANFLQKEQADRIFQTLIDELDWVHHDKVPRSEYYVNLLGDIPYTYGSGRGVRTYQAQPMHSGIKEVQDELEKFSFLLGEKFDVCFLNRYDTQRDQLGWHADNSPEMDDARHIAIISLGAERKIMFKGNDNTEVEEILLEHGSLCLMCPGMQDTHQHRIPKADRTVGKRISFTFRGFTKS